MGRDLTPGSIAEIAKQIDINDENNSESIEPKIISQYPEFNRDQIDTDDTQKYFAKMNSFPRGYKCKVQATRPEPKHQAAHSHGGS